MIDPVLKDFVDCFKASPTDAQVDVAKVWKLIQEVRLIEREACAVLADECLNIEELGDVIRSRNER